MFVGALDKVKKMKSSCIAFSSVEHVLWAVFGLMGWWVGYPPFISKAFPKGLVPYVHSYWHDDFHASMNCNKLVDFNFES